jgi:hypothetical protein
MYRARAKALFGGRFWSGRTNQKIGIRCKIHFRKDITYVQTIYYILKDGIFFPCEYQVEPLFALETLPEKAI